MQFSTPVNIPAAPWQITYNDRLLMLGSCFTDNMARKMQQYFLPVTANPFGTLYNPVSIAHHLTADTLDGISVVILTFGTAWVYVDKETGRVVDNCQKRPAADFVRRRLTTNEIVQLWQPFFEQYPHLRFLFTVSPIRHIKDGLHENQLSKAILLQAVEQLVQTDPSRIAYFPAYEIVLDELRDYRFYAADMLHPSETAVDYIWERFCDTYLTEPSTRQTMRERHQLWLDLNHRPLNPDSEEYKRFRQQAEKRLKELHLQL